ncbi:TPA: AMP-binding protein [Streptococcus suis]
MKDIISFLQHKNIYNLLKYLSQEYGTLPAITNCGSILSDYSYQELFEHVQRVATGIQVYREIAFQQNNYFSEKKSRKPCHYVLCAKNSYNWIVCFLSIICSGDVVIPLDENITDVELVEALTLVDACVLITDREFDCVKITHHKLEEFIQYMKTLSLKYEYHFDNNDNEPSVFLMTSGVTASPKFVMLSQANLIYSILNCLDAVPIEPGKRVLSILPPHHSYEISCGILYQLCSGSHIYINDDKENFINNLRHIRPQCLVAVPSIVYALIALMKGERSVSNYSSIDTLEIIYCGGASIDNHSIELLKSNGVLVLQGYGMTECSPTITVNRLDDFTTNTVGKPMHFVQLRIENKEIYVKAPNVMIGYYKNPIATAEVLQNGWLRTGDVGYFDLEGHLVLHGRVKNIIVLNTGENVYPEELEERIFQKNPQIQYCKVYEEKGNVSVELFSNTLSENSLYKIIADVNNEISTFKRIKQIHVLQNMPKVTALGKPYRR